MIERSLSMDREGIKPANAGKSWTEDEIFIVASYVPNWPNANYLAQTLGRTPHAIQYMWCKLYWPVKRLKEFAAKDTRDEQYTRILNARRKAQICIRGK